MPNEPSPTPTRPARASTATANGPSERESRESWEDEGGSLEEGMHDSHQYRDRVVSGRIVQAGGSGTPFKVVLTHEDGHTSEHPAKTMREGEAFIRRVSPTPPKRDASRDHGPGQA